MKKQDFSGIILAGGTSSRMKLESDVPKQLMNVTPSKSMLQYQIDWLKSNGVSDIVIAIDKNTYDYIIDHVPHITREVHIAIELRKLGTGGAIKNAARSISNPQAYVMNVDDFIISEFYTPDELVNRIRDFPFEGVVLTSRGQFPYGVIRSRGRRVTRFEQKPTMDFKVSAGHYAFHKDFILDYFPDQGEMEEILFPKMTKKGLLSFMDLDGNWVTANTYKEIIVLWKCLAELKQKRLYGTCVEEIISNPF